MANFDHHPTLKTSSPVPSFTQTPLVHLLTSAISGTGVWLWIAAAVDWTITVTLWKTIEASYQGFSTLV